MGAAADTRRRRRWQNGSALARSNPSHLASAAAPLKLGSKRTPSCAEATGGVQGEGWSAPRLQAKQTVVTMRRSGARSHSPASPCCLAGAARSCGGFLLTIAVPARLHIVIFRS